jgi:cytochrome P450
MWGSLTINFMSNTMLTLFRPYKRTLAKGSLSFMNTSFDQGQVDAVAFGLFSGQLTENPFSALAQLRTMGAVLPASLPFGDGTNKTWIVTHLEEATYILKNHHLFTVDAANIGPDGFSFFRQSGADEPAINPFGETMQALDEPDHRRLRGLIAKAFTPRYVQGLRPLIQQIADELLDSVQGQSQMELVKDFALPLPINVISEMMGVPADKWEQILTWSDTLASAGLMPTVEQKIQMHGFLTYVAQLVTEKRQHPANDLISQLIQVEEEGQHLKESELIASIAHLIFAGHETTSGLISIGTLMLLDHPEQFSRLKADPQLIPAAVEELLRFNGPITLFPPRFATEALEIGGQQIQRGDILIILPPSINRDEAQFEQADTLDITRHIDRNAAFGYGIHMCLGMPLARMEGEIAFTTLLRKMPNLRLAVPRDAVPWSASGSLRGLISLPVAF